MKSCQNQIELIDLFRNHTTIFNEFYIDCFKPLKLESIQAIARNYLNEKLNETREKRYDHHQMLNELNDKLSTLVEEQSNKESKITQQDTEDDDDDVEDDYLDLKDIDTYSIILANLHMISYNYYLRIYMNNLNNIRPKPFSFVTLKQIFNYYFIYMKRIYKQEKEKLDKYDEVFKKLQHVQNEIRKYGEEIVKLKEHLIHLDRRLSAWEAKIDKQKQAYKIAVDECRKEEKLVEEMSNALDKLKSDSNKEYQDLNKLLNPQYEAALRALNAIDENSIAELRSYRLPPQRVLAVVNTLCVMFDKEPDWENGKLLLLRENFYEQLVYFDKANIPDDIYFKLEKIIALESFKPEEVKPGSLAAAALCEWILAVFEYCTIARSINSKDREIREYEELYKTRQTKLGEKRLFAEKERVLLEDYCKERVNVLKEINYTQKRIESLNDARDKAEYLLKLLDNDNKNWHQKSFNCKKLLVTYKTDALLAACYISYAGIFDYEHRDKLLNKWFNYFKKNDLENSTNKIRFFATELTDQQQQQHQKTPSKYSIRANFNLKDIIFNHNDLSKDVWMQLYLMANNDSYFVNNAILIHELCSHQTVTWPIIYDPENYSIKFLTLLQHSIHVSKEPFVKSMLDYWSHEESKRRESQMLGTISEDGESTIGTSVSRRQSVVTFSDSASRSVSRTSRKSYATQMSERSSIWETSTFLSRAFTNASVYYTKSGKTFLAKYEDDIEPAAPMIEADITSFPKDNLMIIEANDLDLDYKLVNAAVHGVAVYLRNAETRQYSRLIEKFINHDFTIDAIGRETIKIGDDDIKIHPAFKLILHVSTPMHAFNSKYNYLAQRLINHSNSAVSVIDFTPSFNYIASDLLNTILDFEKSGYMNQCLLAEKMLSEAQYNVYNREVYFKLFMCSHNGLKKFFIFAYSKKLLIN